MDFESIIIDEIFPGMCLIEGSYAYDKTMRLISKIFEEIF